LSPNSTIIKLKNINKKDNRGFGIPTLDFKGKQFVYYHHLSVPFRKLEVKKDKSLPLNGEKTNLDDNLIIQGDNLEVLCTYFLIR